MTQTDDLRPTMRTLDDLDAGLAHIRASAADHGPIELIARRPSPAAREVVDEAVLDLVDGLVGDNWRTRGSSKMPDGSAHPEKQLTLMNSRAIAQIAGDRGNWPVAGDQFYVELDLGPANLPPGIRLGLGTAVIEVTVPPHLGCKKFSERFGPAALRWVNSPVGRTLNLRGINAKVVTPGSVRRGDLIHKL